MNRAVFLDRDGTIIDDVGHLHRLEDIRILPGAAESIARLNDAGWLVIVVTNQSVVARGLLDESMLRVIHAAIDGMLRQSNAHVDEWYYCPHLETGTVREYAIKCTCRKPQPGMLFRAAANHGISLEQSWMIGDSPSDVEAGILAGTRTIHIGRDVNSLREAVDRILLLC